MKHFISKFLILIFLFSPLLLMAQEEILIRPQYSRISEKHRNKIDSLGHKQGLWKYFTRDGILFMEVTFQNNVKHGSCTRHSTSTGTVIEESNYFNGKRDGEYRRYSYSGLLISEGFYENGKKNGKWITYYPVNNETKSEGFYNKGKREGFWKYYNSKGKLKLQGEYKDGLRDGDWITYAGDGSVVETKKFIKGLTQEEVELAAKKKSQTVSKKTSTIKRKTQKTPPGETKTPKNN